MRWASGFLSRCGVRERFVLRCRRRSAILRPSASWAAISIAGDLLQKGRVHLPEQVKTPATDREISGAGPGLQHGSTRISPQLLLTAVFRLGLIVSLCGTVPCGTSTRRTEPALKLGQAPVNRSASLPEGRSSFLRASSASDSLDSVDGIVTARSF